MKISGFTIVRNAGLLKYPFCESVLSVLPLCSEFIINCGDSDDNTLQMCRELADKEPKIRVIETVWSRENQSGGFQLKHQTDKALKECSGDWCFYIQSDEVIHESDFPSIIQAIDRAEQREDVDGLTFDYLHFYGNYDYILKGRGWYRREVRLFKNGRGIESHRDAQGFRRQGERIRALESGARVFHYGYVRTPDQLETKVRHMSQWWGETPKSSPEAYQIARKVGQRAFTGSHPKAMRSRISSSFDLCDPGKGSLRLDLTEVKDAITLAWESIFPYRIGEFRNYELV